MKGTFFMIQTIKNNWVLVAAGVAAFALLLVAPMQAAYAADIDNCVKTGSNLELDPSCSNPDVSQGEETVNQTITNVINIFSVIVGIVAVIMLIYGGFRYVTSGGDSGNIGNAKNTILYAIVGLVIVAIAQAVVQFVLGSV